MYKIRTISAILMLSVASVAAQAVEFGGEIGVVSDYVFRGISQKDEHAAIQGGLSLTWESGFKAGVWASEVDEGSETDFYVSYTGLSDMYGTPLNYSIGITQYEYSDNWFADDYTELNLGLGTQYQGGAIGLVINYSPSIFDDYYGDDVAYTNAQLYYERSTLFPDISGHINIGYSDFSFNSRMSGSYDFNYTNWNIGISRVWPCKYGEVQLDIDYHDTDLTSVTVADARIVAGVKYSF